MSGVSFTVLGTPAPQGSKVRTRYGMREASKTTLPWRAVVAARAHETMNGAPPLEGPLNLNLVFRLPRPKAHYRTGKHAHELKPNAPTWSVSKPDTDKLIRAIGDALTTGGVYRDDSQVATVHARKVYASLTHLPGVDISVELLEAL